MRESIKVDLIQKNALAIPPCAHIAQFKQICIFEVVCAGKNVLVKTKGSGECLPRIGNSMDRVGFVGWITGKRIAKDRLDLTTNTTSVNLTFTSVEKPPP